MLDTQLETRPRHPFEDLIARGWQSDEHHQLLGLIFILNGLDAIATIAWLQMGIAREANPFMDQLIALHPAFFVTLKLSLVGLGVALLSRYREHRMARGASYALFMTFSLLICYHIAGGILLG